MSMTTKSIPSWVSIDIFPQNRLSTSSGVSRVLGIAVAVAMVLPLVVSSAPQYVDPPYGGTQSLESGPQQEWDGEDDKGNQGAKYYSQEQTVKNPRSLVYSGPEILYSPPRNQVPLYAHNRRVIMKPIIEALRPPAPPPSHETPVTAKPWYFTIGEGSANTVVPEVASESPVTAKPTPAASTERGISRAERVLIRWIIRNIMQKVAGSQANRPVRPTTVKYPAWLVNLLMSSTQKPTTSAPPTTTTAATTTGPITTPSNKYKTMLESLRRFLQVSANNPQTTDQPVTTSWSFQTEKPVENRKATLLELMRRLLQRESQNPGTTDRPVISTSWSVEIDQTEATKDKKTPSELIREILQARPGSAGAADGPSTSWSFAVDQPESTQRPAVRPSATNPWSFTFGQSLPGSNTNPNTGIILPSASGQPTLSSSSPGQQNSVNSWSVVFGKPQDGTLPPRHTQQSIWSLLAGQPSSPSEVNSVNTWSLNSGRPQSGVSSHSDGTWSLTSGGTAQQKPAVTNTNIDQFASLSTLLGNWKAAGASPARGSPVQALSSSGQADERLFLSQSGGSRMTPY